MELLSTLVSIVLGLLTISLVYALYMSRHYGVFRGMGVKHLTPWPAVGSFPTLGKMGFMEFHKHIYKKFHQEKVYGFYEAATPILVIRDLDMLREIMIKNFNCFVNRRVFPSEEPFDHVMTALVDDHWRHVRNTISPTFSSGKLKKMCLLVEQTAKSLTSNIRNACRDDKEIELKHLFGCYTIDVIANTGFGVSVDSLNDENSPFVTQAQNIINFGSSGVFAFIFLFPMIHKLLTKMGIGFFNKESLRFFNSFLDAAMEKRSSSNADSSQKRHNFVELVAAEKAKNEASTNAENGGGSVVGEENQERKGLTLLDAQGQALIFILAGYETVSTALSFALFTLTHKPEITQKIQEELDEVLAGKPATYENVNSLVYMDMCLNESLRMYPPGFIIDRMCTQDCEIDGVKIPKGMAVTFPFISIFNDPEYFPNPEEFDPERFSADNKASRHPFAFLPFGQGPRNCIGMRLALMEMKIALASILQQMTPVSCSKSVYPPKIEKFQLKAEDGLWVKFEPRKEV